MTYHKPVLLKETIDALAIKQDGVYVDATFGGGGHSRAILNRLSRNGRLIAFDQDPDARANVIHDDRFVFIEENFRYMNRFLKFHQIHKVDGILADLGVSSHQFDKPERGFSIRYDGMLDMRMDQKSNTSARKVINTYSEEALSSLLFSYGELRNAKFIAKKIVEARACEKIETSFQFRRLLQKFLPDVKGNKTLAKIFQAIRIEVNQELSALKELLSQVPSILRPDGRLCMISYHSLEDRLVKRFIRTGLFSGEPEKDLYGNVKVPLVKIKKLVVPKSFEISINNRARSAKLRIAEPRKNV